MFKQPVINDPENPLVSILIFNYAAKHLKHCFDSIFSQTILENIEVIFCDDASSDGSWNTALEYARKYDGIITVTRNSEGIGGGANGNNCHRKCRGKYFVPLYYNLPFQPEYIKQSIQTMETNQFIEFRGVHRFTAPPSHFYIDDKPIVTVCIYNYNYGNYLRQCFDSVFAQTYDNFELCFSDNASTDNSWDIALEYMNKYPDRMTVTRNRKNFGPSSNLENCYINMRGKYVLKLCSDDAIMPDFIERCVHALEANPATGFAMVHRTIIDENGNRTEEPSFYNQSCVIPGAEQAAVYMMSSVNPSVSQIMYNWNKTHGKRIVGSLTDRWYGDWIQDFNMCCEYPMVYIKEPLLLHRVHSQSDGASIDSNLIQCTAQYVQQHQFVDIAKSYNHLNVVERLPQAIEKLSRLCLRYCIRFLCSNDERCALRYFHLSRAIMPEIAEDEIFMKLQNYWDSDALGKATILQNLKTTGNLVFRSVSYDPPLGSTPLQL